MLQRDWIKSVCRPAELLRFKYREADYGIFPAGLMYGLQVMDSWLYDETRPFIHIEAGDTYRSLREKVETGYF